MTGSKILSVSAENTFEKARSLQMMRIFLLRDALCNYRLLRQRASQPDQPIPILIRIDKSKQQSSAPDHIPLHQIRPIHKPRLLGPAIQRFGRGYATDLWPATPGTANALVRLLDVAYVLVFAGFILMTAELDLGTPGRAGECLLTTVDCHTVGSQVQSAAQRIGGLVLVMGILHAVTITVLPVVALVSNSTRLGRPLPKWLVVLLVLAGVGVGFVLVNALIGALVGMAGS